MIVTKFVNSFCLCCYQFHSIANEAIVIILGHVLCVLTGVPFTTVYLQGKESLSQGTHILSWQHSDTLPSSCINFQPNNCVAESLWLTSYQSLLLSVLSIQLEWSGISVFSLEFPWIQERFSYISVDHLDFIFCDNYLFLYLVHFFFGLFTYFSYWSVRVLVSFFF